MKKAATVSKSTKKTSSRSRQRSPKSADSTTPPRHAQQPQTVIGVVILCAVLVFGLSMLVRSGSLPSKMPTELGVTPAATIASPMPGIVLDPLHTTPSAATATAAGGTSPAAIQVPAATTSAVTTYPTFKVKKNQTFWEFAKRYCGSHTFAEKLAQDNGYKLVTDLKEGDWIKITCN